MVDGVLWAGISVSLRTPVQKFREIDGSGGWAPQIEEREQLLFFKNLMRYFLGVQTALRAVWTPGGLSGGQSATCRLMAGWWHVHRGWGGHMAVGRVGVLSSGVWGLRGAMIGEKSDRSVGLGDTFVKTLKLCSSKRRHRKLEMRVVLFHSLCQQVLILCNF